MKPEWRRVSAASTACAEDTFALLTQADEADRVSGDPHWSIEVMDDGHEVHFVDVRAAGHEVRFVVSGEFTNSTNRNDRSRALLGLAQHGRVRPVNSNAILLELEVCSVPIRVPRQLDAKGTMCVRQLSADHAFIANSDTGEAMCGHAFTANRLHNWLNAAARIGSSSAAEGQILQPCPECSAAGETMSLLLVGEKRDKAEKPLPFDMATWKRDAEEAKELAGDDIDARKRSAVVAIEKLAKAPKPLMQLILVGKTGVPGILDEAKKTIAADFLRSKNWWAKAWQRVTVVPFSIVLTATVFDLPLDDALIELFKDVSWHKKARAKQRNAAKRARGGKEDGDAAKEDGDSDPEEKVVPPGTADKDDFVFELPAGRDSMKRKLNAHADKHPELNFTIYSRDRCSEQIIRELSVGELSSYQKVVKWAAERLTDTAATAPQGLLLDHDTGSGKTVSLWLTLGVAWNVARVNQLHQTSRAEMPAGYKPKILFVTSKALAKKQDPAKDVWAFYKAAGPDAYDEIRSTVSAAEKEGKNLPKGRKWELLYPAEGGKHRSRIISFIQLHNALHAQNHIGKALYGYEVANNRPDNRFVQALDKPAENRIGTDELFEALNSQGSYRRLNVTALEKELKKAKTDALKEIAQKSLDLARDGSKNPLDPLRDAVIVIDEADLLFKADNEIGGNRVETIERAIFHSYNVSGKNAVRLVLGTATPAHTDIRSTFRLLNVLVVDAKQRVHNVGTPDTEAGVNPTIEELAGPDALFMTGKMTRFMMQLQNSISRVNVSKDMDHFPMRSRTDVPVGIHADFEDDYNKQLVARLGRGKNPSEGDVEMTVGAPDDGGDADFDPFADADERAEGAAQAVENTSAGVDDTSEGVVVHDAPDQVLDLSTQELKKVQQQLTIRANNIRRNAMLLPIKRSRAVPDTYRLGHKNFNRGLIEDEIVAGGMPKIQSLLTKIAELDKVNVEKGLPLPKHAIITATLGDYGATLIGAGLSAAGYYWRPMRRDMVRKVGISFVHPSSERNPESLPSQDPWAQHAVGTSEKNLLPAPVDMGNAAFVVLHDSLLDMNLERGFERRARTGYRAYSDFMIVGKPALVKLIHSKEGADPMEVGAVDDALIALARRPIYIDPQSEGSLFFTRSSRAAGVPDMITMLTDAEAVLPQAVVDAHASGGLTLDTLMDAGIVVWTPTLTHKQQEVAAKVVTSAFNDRENNFNGELARIIVISPAFATGIDLADVQYVHLLDPTEVVEEGKDGVALTRDRIQAEGRAWRRCGHKGLRQKIFGGEDTTVTLFSYLLDSKRLNFDAILSVIRSTRQLVIPEVMDEGQPRTTQGHDAVVAMLIQDPAEQNAMVSIRDLMSANAFDSVVSTTRDVKAPVYTGYVTTDDDVPLYRAPGARQGFVTVDGEVHPSADTLFDLWKQAAVRYEPRLASVATGVADVEQEAIEIALLGETESRLDVIVSAQRLGLSTEVRASEMHNLLIAGKQADYRKKLEDAYRVLGIRVMFDTARRVALASFDKDNKAWFLPSLARAQLRSKYVSGTELDVGSFMRTALQKNQDEVVAFLHTGGQPLLRVLETAARIDAQSIGDLVGFFSRDWGINVGIVLNAIATRPKVPGETVGEYRMALFQALASNRYGRWLRLVQAAQDIFIPEVNRKKKSSAVAVKKKTKKSSAVAATKKRAPVDEQKQQARARVNIALSVAAARNYEVNEPLNREGMGPMHNRAWSVINTLDADKDFSNYTIARQFAKDYIEDLRSSATAAPTVLYSRMSRIARRLKLTEFLPDFVAYYMMLRVVTLSERANARRSETTPVVTPEMSEADEGGGVRRGRELETALFLLIAQQVAGQDLMLHLDEFSLSRNGAGLDIVNDGVRALLETDADWDRTAAMLTEAAMEGEHDTGFVILPGGPGDTFPDGAGQPLLHRFDTFDKKGRGVFLSYYVAGGGTTTHQVNNVKDRNWAESLGIWIANCNIKVENMDTALKMFSASVLRDATRVAVTTVLADKVPRPSSARALGYTEVVTELVLASRQGAIKLDCNAIRAHFDTIWKAAGPTFAGDSFFSQDKDTQRNLLGVYGRRAGQTKERLWTALLSIADAAATLFSAGIPDVHRRVMYVLAQQTTGDPFVGIDVVKMSELLTQSPLVEIWGETNPAQYLLSARSSSAMIDGMGKANAVERGHKTDVTIDEAMLLQWAIATDNPFPMIAEVGSMMQKEAEINNFLRSPVRRRVGRASVSTLLVTEQFVHWAQQVTEMEGEMRSSAQARNESNEETLQEYRGRFGKAKFSLDAEETAALESDIDRMSDGEVQLFKKRLDGARAQMVTLQKRIRKAKDGTVATAYGPVEERLKSYIDAYAKLLGAAGDTQRQGDAEMSDAPEVIDIGTPIQQQVAALPMFITEPAHLRGEIIPVVIAKKLVFEKPVNDDDMTLRVASGFAKLPSGSVLNAWKDNIIAERFGSTF